MPSLEVAPTTLATFIANRSNRGGVRNCENFRLAVTYLQFPIHVYGWPPQQLLSSSFPHVTVNFDLWPWPSNLT